MKSQKWSPEATQIFYDNLKEGQEIELHALNTTCSIFHSSLKKRCDTNAYDFKLNNGLKFEVKDDKKSKYTGNVFIEYQQNFKPSGIRTTQADYYIIRVDTHYYFIDVRRLTSLINDMINDKTIIKAKTNITVPTKGFLINVSKLKELSFIVPLSYCNET